MPALALGPQTGLPARVSVPLSGGISPASMRSSVDLPEPDCPRMVTNSPACTVSDTSRSTGVGRLFSPINVLFNRRALIITS